jgi:small-conductance mechanosensitive channel
MKYWENSLEEWVAAVAIAAILFVVFRVVLRIVVRRLAGLAERTKTPVDDLLVAVLGRTRMFFLSMVSIYAACQYLVLPMVAARVVSAVSLLSLLLQVGIWGNAAIAFLVARTAEVRTKTDQGGAATVFAFSLVARLVLWTVLLLLGLDNLGVNITGLVAGLGIGGIAVALAVQRILGDLFASLSIALDKPFVVGDFIIVDQMMGSVEHIGLKTTRVRSLSGEQIIFSNTDLLDSRIKNYKRMYERRVVFTIGVTYETAHATLSCLAAILRSIIEMQHDTRFDRAHFKEYADSALVFEVVYYVTTPDYNRYMDIQHAINLDILTRLAAEGIEFAYPTQRLILEGITPRHRSAKRTNGETRAESALRRKT